MKFVVSVAPAWAGERVKDKQTDFPRSNAGKNYGDGLRPRFGKHAVRLFFEIGDCFCAVTTIQYLPHGTEIRTGHGVISCSCDRGWPSRSTPDDYLFQNMEEGICLDYACLVVEIGRLGA